ncbi:MAG: DUF4129 domain-containing protein [Acidimicrobiales bacterium]
MPEPDPGQVRERADQILARAEFNEPESILDRVSRWISEAFGDLFNSLSQGGAGSIVAWFILVGLVAAMVVLVRRMGPLSGLAGPASTAVTVDIVGPAATEFRSASQWRTEADRLAGAGLFDQALRARYRALLADLIIQGLLEDIPGRTAGEYRREFAAAAPPAAASFNELTDQFEGVWYGARVADAADLSRFDGYERAVAARVPR